MDVNDISLNENGSLKEALTTLDQTGAGAVFIIDNDRKLVGLLTDGDIRRALLAGHNLDTRVSGVMNRKFVSLPVSTDNNAILDKINNAVKVIPLVDNDNRLVDYASAQKIRRIAVATPSLNGNELAYVTDCIRTSWISSAGKYVRKFEEQFTEYHEGMRALAVSNGTVALHLALEALNIGAGDEVIVPDLTFAASINSVLYTGATPVLADVDPVTWNIDVTKIEALITKKTKAIMPVHLYGLPCDMDEIMRLAKKHKLLVIEDAAEALGSYYKGRPVGVFGDVATFSFYGNKTVTTGEGGMIVFKDPEVAERAAMLRDHGMLKTKRYWHAEVGYNYRMTNIQAAIGVAQVERLDEFVSAKRHIAKTYNETLADLKAFQVAAIIPGYLNSYWLYTTMVKPGAGFTRDQLIEYLGNHGVETRPVFYPLHVMPPYVNYGSPENLKVSKQLSEQGISFPTSVNLTEMELAHICKVVTAFAKKF